MKWYNSKKFATVMYILSWTCFIFAVYKAYLLGFDGLILFVAMMVTPICNKQLERIRKHH